MQGEAAADDSRRWRPPTHVLHALQPQLQGPVDPVQERALTDEVVLCNNTRETKVSVAPGRSAFQVGASMP
jgi:hypothetical protein